MMKAIIAAMDTLMSSMESTLTKAQSLSSDQINVCAVLLDLLLLSMLIQGRRFNGA